MQWENKYISGILLIIIIIAIIIITINLFVRSCWGAVWNISASEKYQFCRRQAKRAETANYFSAHQNLHPASTALVSLMAVLKLSPVGV